MFLVVDNLEGSIARLGDNMTALHKPLEDMLRDILRGRGMKGNSNSKDLSNPLLLGKAVETSTLTSMTTQAWIEVLDNSLILTLQPLCIGGVPPPFL